MSTNGRNRGFPQTVWEEIGKLFNRYTTMTVLLSSEHDDDDDDDDDDNNGEHCATRFRPVRRRNATTPTMTEINSDDGLYNFMTAAAKRKTRKCTAACARPVIRGGGGGTADTSAAAQYCADAVQRTCRPSASQHDRGPACNRTAVECRCQCARTGRHGADDRRQQCAGARNRRPDNGGGQCAGTGKHDGPCTGVAKTCRAADDGRFAGTGNRGANNTGCGCVSATAAAAAAAAALCPGGADAVGRYSNNAAVTAVCRWARAAKDWTWDKTSHILVAVVSFFLGMVYADWCLSTYEDVFEM